MFLVVKELNETTGEFIQCIQYGGWGDFVYPECVVVGKWPSSWSKHATGWYYYLADVSSAGFSGSSWEICVGNGYKGSYEESYTGSLFFTGSMITTGIPPTSMPSSMPSFVPTISFQPTSIPSGVPSAVPTQTIIPSRAPSLMPSTSVAPTATHWTIQSKCLDTVYLSYDLSLAGKEYECIIVPAKGLATSINISLYFSGSSGLEWPYDMAFALKSPTGPGIQVGGFEYYLPNISYAGPWPFEWRSPLDGWYYANVSIGKYGVEGSGDYTVCMVNAWVEATEVSYQGQVALDGLDYDCTPSPSPAPTSSPSSLPWILDGECGENTQLSYDLQLAGFESSCYSLDAAGFIQYLDIVLHFSGSVNGEWPSDMSLSVKFEDGIGFRIGGFDDEDPDLVYLGSWPPSWRNTSDGTYQAFVNISSALIVDSGEVEICITNGWEYAHMVHYDGHLELLGLIRTCDKKKSNNNDDDGNQTALALGLSIPLVLLAVALGGYFVISYYRKSEQ